MAVERDEVEFGMRQGGTERKAGANTMIDFLLLKAEEKLLDRTIEMSSSGNRRCLFRYVVAGAWLIADEETLNYLN